MANSNARCIGQDESANLVNEVLPNWLPPTVQRYLAHVGTGLSIRDLARQSECHASTISRQVRRIEQQRDDPLFDAGLRCFEQKMQSGDAGLITRVKRNFAVTTTEDLTESNLPENYEKEALRVLRRLCEPGSVMAIAENMDTAVVVREGADGAPTRTAVVAQDIAQAMALKGWIETQGAGRVLRYTITTTGRDQVKAALQGAAERSDTVLAFQEAPSTFDGAVRVNDDDAPKPVRKGRYSLAESPLSALARRREKDGSPFLSEDLVRCGERLREDFELAQMGEQVVQNWTHFLTSGVHEPVSNLPVSHYGPEAAKGRVVAALRDLGPGLSDVVLRCCCFLEGLEQTEKLMGWSARSGKIVLRIALQRLQRHYEENLTPEAQLIG